MKKLQSIPSDIKQALLIDGAIRLIDGRWSRGFVDIVELEACVKQNLLDEEFRQGWSFAIPVKIK